MVLAGWPCADQSGFARLLGQFTSDVRDHLGDLEALCVRVAARQPVSDWSGIEKHRPAGPD
jgi:hypothetical protein